MRDSTIAYLGLGLLALLLLSGGAAAALGMGAGDGGGGGGNDKTTLPGETRRGTQRASTPYTYTAPGQAAPGARLGLLRTTAITTPTDPRLTYEGLRAAETQAGVTFFTRTQQGFGGPGATPGVQVPISAAFSFGGDTFDKQGNFRPTSTLERRTGLRTEAVTRGQPGNVGRTTIRPDVRAHLDAKPQPYYPIVSGASPSTPKPTSQYSEPIGPQLPPGYRVPAQRDPNRQARTAPAQERKASRLGY